MSDEAAKALGRLRIDKWLWAERFYKTRSRAVEGGKVNLNGEGAKSGKGVRPGDGPTKRDWRMIRRFTGD